ncbi:hypothetical protein [Cedecea neteri]|uniref:Uncharacterized protein n=1 Tax=Cedecea neteri TaxID=158822 RepID=A0A291DXE1_9ENTR|nr:hypothetical protein [Cedecea neteri]ATF92296.1 hypothetical protein CO704_09460 [Cedecea neteri]
MTGPIGSIGFSVPLMGANITAKVKAPVVPTPAIQASTRVTLSGASDSISAVYSFGAQKLRANTPAGNSNLSMLMGATLSQPASVSFQGLGKELLLALKDNPKGFSLAVASPAAAAADGDVTQDKDSAVALNIETQSGVKVSISLSRQSEGLVAEVQTSGGDLTDDDVAAISGLAEGFQNALDGLAQQPPALKIGGLLNVDSKLFKSVELNTDVSQAGSSIQSLSFQSDSTQRALSYKDADATFNLTTDLSAPGTLGSKSQQAQALSAYEKQLDGAGSRGHANKAQLALFKSAFHALNSDYGSNEAKTSGIQQTITVSAEDKARSYLSGLADFTASFKQADVASNPYKSEENDSFSYDFSQTTQASTDSRGDLSKLVQNTRASLKASYHESLLPGEKLDLKGLKSSQNYTYHVISEETTTQTALEFKKGNLASVETSRATHNAEYVQTYVAARLTDEKRTPFDKEETKKVNLLADNISLKSTNPLNLK